MRLGGRNPSMRNTLILITNDHYRGRQWLRLLYCANFKDSRLPPQRSSTGYLTIPACCRAISGKTSVRWKMYSAHGSSFSTPDRFGRLWSIRRVVPRTHMRPTLRNSPDWETYVSV